MINYWEYAGNDMRYRITVRPIKEMEEKAKPRRCCGLLAIRLSFYTPVRNGSTVFGAQAESVTRLES